VEWEEFCLGSMSFILSFWGRSCARGLVYRLLPAGVLGMVSTLVTSCKKKTISHTGHTHLQTSMLMVSISRYINVCSPRLRRCMSTANLTWNIGLTVRRQVPV